VPGQSPSNWSVSLPQTGAPSAGSVSLKLDRRRRGQWAYAAREVKAKRLLDE
jgi:hypothetical protein